MWQFVNGGFDIAWVIDVGRLVALLLEGEFFSLLGCHVWIIGLNCGRNVALLFCKSCFV